MSVLRAFRMQIPIVRWVPGLWGHFTAHEILQPWSTTCCPSPPVQADSPCSPVYLQNASWAVRNLGVVHWGLTQTPKSSRNSKLATCAFGSWCPVPSSGSRGHTGGRARDRSPHHQHTSPGRWKSINWRLHLSYNIEHPSAAAPIHSAKPFQTHLYFCQGEFTNLIRCLWKDTGFCSF